MSLFVCSLPCFPAPPPSLPINLHTCFPCTHHKIICLLAYNNNLLSFCLIFESLCILSVRLTVLTHYSKVCQSALLSSTPTSFSSSFAQPQLTQPATYISCPVPLRHLPACHSIKSLSPSPAYHSSHSSTLSVTQPYAFVRVNPNCSHSLIRV